MVSTEPGATLLEAAAGLGIRLTKTKYILLVRPQPKDEELQAAPASISPIPGRW